MTNESVRNFKFDQFVQDGEEWEYYIQRFELETAIHGLDTADMTTHKRNILLSKVGPDSFKILVDYFKPDNVMSKTYKEIVKVLNDYYGKKTFVLSERVTFALRWRGGDETVTQFVSALRGLAGSCEFGDGLNERLRDQLVIGINNTAWQQDIIREYSSNASTFADVEATALKLEQASIHAKRLTALSHVQADAQHSLQSSPQHTNRVNTSNRKPGFQGRFKNSTTNKSSQKWQIKTLDARKHCLSCGTWAHSNRNDCPARGKICLACHKLNHFAAVCIVSGRARIINERRPDTRHVRQNETDTFENENHSISSTDTSNIRNIHSTNKVIISALINDHSIEMLYDPGAAHSVVGKSLWKKIGRPSLQKVANLIAYTDLEIPTLGMTQVKVSAFGIELKLPLYIIGTDDIPLFGLDWCLAFKLPMPPGSKLCQIGNNLLNHHQSNTMDRLNSVLQTFKELFNGTMGTIKGHTAKIHIPSEVQPKTFRPRPVPIALQEQVTAEINRLVREDVLEPVDTMNTSIEWASPIVTVVKSNGSVRICGDFRVTINPHVQIDEYPLPRFEDIMAKLSGGMQFSRIDLKDAYLQLQVHPHSRKYLVIATHKGYFAYKRLPFGITFAPSLFQRTMDQILSGLDGVVIYLDDIFITAPNIEEHLQRLHRVLERLQAAGIRAQEAKCAWLQDSLTFLGHRIDKYGLHPTDEHIQAIKNMPVPTNTSQLRSFLGSITYYGRFIPNLHVICVPLHRHLKKGSSWKWTSADDTIFKELKDILTSRNTLAHYNPNLPLYVTSDASDKGLGAVLFHRFPNDIFKPVAYASRSLSDTESRYATIDKEALGIIFAVTRFNQFLYGRSFTLLTDHKPLERIFGENRETPKIVSNRLLRWAILLNSYNFAIAYHRGKDNAPADALSRLPLANYNLTETEEVGLPKRGQLLHLRMHHIPITQRTLRKRIGEDRLLREVIRCQNSSWPDKKDVPTELLTFYEKRDELSLEEGILLWRGRICIPESLKGTALQMLHDGHPGICAMRSMARIHVYWPNIDKEIDEFVKGCRSCQESRENNTKLPLYPWCAPPEPWSRVHIDFAGPFENRMWLIVIDAYSRWLEVLPMNNITSKSTITALREVFARYGLPNFIVSDNGPQLTSDEFETFCDDNGITHIKITPYHPKSNGIAERVIKTFKNRMLASDHEKDIDYRLQQFLFSYRNTPQRSTGRAPSELMFGRTLRSLFDQLKPDVKRNMEKEKLKQKQYHDKGARDISFDKDEPVWVNNPITKGCTPGRVVEQTGPYSYIVDVQGVPRRKHADQMRSRTTYEHNTSHTVSPIPNVDINDRMPNLPLQSDSTSSLLDVQRPRIIKDNLEPSDGTVGFKPIEPVEQSGSSPEVTTCTPRRNPPRLRRPPARYDC